MRKTTDPEKAKYQDFIKRYLIEQGIPLSPWSSVQPLYLRYRGRCLKLKPKSYKEFLNTCAYEPLRKTKYDDQGNLKDGCKQGWNQSCTTQPLKEEKDYAGAYYKAKQARGSYKSNYKEPPKKEDFELDKDYRKARQDYNYIRDQLAEYEAVKALDSTHWKKPLVPKEGGDLRGYRYMFRYPFLIRYALRCLSGEYPPECFPEVLNDIKGELKELLNKQREVYNREPLYFPWSTNLHIFN